MHFKTPKYLMKHKNFIIFFTNVISLITNNYLTINDFLIYYDWFTNGPSITFALRRWEGDRRGFRMLVFQKLKMTSISKNQLTAVSKF